MSRSNNNVVMDPQTAEHDFTATWMLKAARMIPLGHDNRLIISPACPGDICGNTSSADS